MPQWAPTAPGVGTVPTWPWAIWKLPPKIPSKLCTLPLVHSKQIRKAMLSHTHTHVWGKNKCNWRLFTWVHNYNTEIHTCKHILVQGTGAWNEILPALPLLVHISARQNANTLTHHTFPLIQRCCVFFLKCRWGECLSWGHPSGLMKLADPDTVSLGSTAGATS